jgi:hypothetical protein
VIFRSDVSQGISTVLGELPLWGLFNDRFENVDGVSARVPMVFTAAAGRWNLGSFRVFIEGRVAATNHL